MTSSLDKILQVVVESVQDKGFTIREATEQALEMIKEQKEVEMNELR